MELKISTGYILKALQILSWIIFIGLCIEAGGIIFNILYTFFINPINTHSFWEGVDLSALYNYDSGYFAVVTSIMAIVAVLKAMMFYLIVKMFTDKILNMEQPFSMAFRKIILLVSYLAFGIGLFSQFEKKYIDWLTYKSVTMPRLEALHAAGSDVWLFMAVVLFSIAQIFKRGIELQNENELTI